MIGPGNRLIKYHLADVQNVDSRSAFQTIRDKYAAITWQQWTTRKIDDLRVMTQMIPEDYIVTVEALESTFRGNFGEASVQIKGLRSQQFFYLVIGSGLLGLAFFLMPAGLFVPALRPIAIVSVVTLAIWAGPMFQPGGTVIHQGSLFPEMAIVVGIVCLLAELSQVLCILLVLMHVALSVFQYAV